jgi:hypothetical protein
MLFLGNPAQSGDGNVHFVGNGGRPAPGISKLIGRAVKESDAIRSVTNNGAYTRFEEKVKGSIEPGKYANFVVLSDDILKVPADEIRNRKVLTAVLGGKTLFGRLD